jgi:hypothetical protein
MLSTLVIFRCQIYSIFSAVLKICLVTTASLAQEINAFKTISSGNYSNPAIWEVFDGATWTAAITKPGVGNDIYIDQKHLVNLIGHEQSKSVFINAETGAAQKLNLNGRELEVFGTLQAFSGAAPGVPSGTWNSLNWIGNSINSKLIFRGNTRTIISKNAWSGFTTNSRFSVIFDPGPGIELTIETPFKALDFMIRSGTLIQKLDSSVIPSVCASLSFNTEVSTSVGPFGNLRIENGAKLISECNNEILFRSASGNISASLFDLQEGGELILEGANPRMEAANFQLHGKVTFRGGVGPKSFLTSSFGNATIPNRINDLEIQGIQNLTLPASLFLEGNMTQTGAGSFQMNNTSLNFSGGKNQLISGFAMTVRNLTIDKSANKVLLSNYLTVSNTLTQVNGILDFNENALFMNTSFMGELDYQGGSWERLRALTYFSVPTTFTATNGTFPFGDRFQKGIRRVQLLGSNAGGNLTISYAEYDGAEYNSHFNDVDTTPILYRLFSYFQFAGLNPSLNPLELRISADNLIVDNVDDLRIVSTGFAAPGTHLSGLDPVILWARRNLTFSDLTGVNFTIGSFRTLSVLPVTWLSFEARQSFAKVDLRWTVAAEKGNKEFEVYRSAGNLSIWKKLGSVATKGDSDESVSYSFTDSENNPNETAYYRIRQIDNSGAYSWSKVVLASPIHIGVEEIRIFPNPYQNGRIRIIMDSRISAGNIILEIIDKQGQILRSMQYSDSECTKYLESLKPGVYMLTFRGSDWQKSLRWIRQ